VAILRDSNDGKQRTGVYDRFRDRIIFPIFDVQDRVIGFGGRVLDDTQPKYLNSPETILFHKSRQLYALEKAKTEATRRNALMVVEGYFDVIALHQAGIRNVVATLGTALTSFHIPLIQRFSKNIKLVFDPDSAGIRAALRTAAVEMLDLFAGRGISVDVVTLPD
jgi:DNA primase